MQLPNLGSTKQHSAAAILTRMMSTVTVPILFDLLHLLYMDIWCTLYIVILLYVGSIINI